MTPAQPNPSPDAILAEASPELAQTLEQAIDEIAAAHGALDTILKRCDETLEQTGETFMADRRRVIIALSAISTIREIAEIARAYRPEAGR